LGAVGAVLHKTLQMVMILPGRYKENALISMPIGVCSRPEGTGLKPLSHPVDPHHLSGKADISCWAKKTPSLQSKRAFMDLSIAPQ
jgi:hypothetical protein